MQPYQLYRISVTLPTAFLTWQSATPSERCSSSKLLMFFFWHWLASLKWAVFTHPFLILYFIMFVVSPSSFLHGQACVGRRPDTPRTADADIPEGQSAERLQDYLSPIYSPSHPPLLNGLYLLYMSFLALYYNISTSPFSYVTPSAINAFPLCKVRAARRWWQVPQVISGKNIMAAFRFSSNNN